MINPSTRGHRGPATQDFPSGCNHFPSHRRPPGVGPPRSRRERSIRRAWATTQPSPASPPGGTSRPRQRQAPGNRAPRTPRGEAAPGNRLLRAASPTAMQSGWFFQVPPNLAPRPVPAPAAPAGQGASHADRGWGARRPLDRGGPFPTLHPEARVRRARAAGARAAEEDGTEHPRGTSSAARPRQSPASARSPGTRAATCATGRSASARTVLRGSAAAGPWAPPTPPRPLPPPESSAAPRSARACSRRGQRDLQPPQTRILTGSQDSHPAGFLRGVCLPDFTP